MSKTTDIFTQNKHLVQKYVNIRKKGFINAGIHIDEEDLRQTFADLLIKAIEKHDASRGSLETFYSKNTENWCKDEFDAYTYKTEYCKSGNGKIIGNVIDITNYLNNEEAEQQPFCEEVTLFSPNGKRSKSKGRQSLPQKALRLVFECDGELVQRRLLKIMDEQGIVTRKSITIGSKKYVFCSVSPRIDNIYGIKMYALEYEQWEELPNSIIIGNKINSSCVVTSEDTPSMRRVDYHMSKRGINTKSFSMHGKHYMMLPSVPLFENADGLEKLDFYWLKHQPWELVHHDMTAFVSM